MKVTATEHITPFLSGGGEMGSLIRAKDWSQTSLGSPETWPQSLRTMVSVMLDNPFGMYIAWGSDYIQLYNDGYRPILGSTKHPSALGISTRETFAEIWHIIGSMFNDVMQGKPVGFPDFMLPLNRNGFVEECYFDFSYSPIRMENGEVGGVLVTVIETTYKKKTEADLKENKNQLQFAIESAELGTWDFNPATNKFIGNQRLKEWFGLPLEGELELPLALQAIAEKDRLRITESIQKVLQFSSGGNFDSQYTIILPVTKREIIVRGIGKVWFGEDEKALRFTGILQNITKQVTAQKKVEESERKLRSLILQAPVAIAIFRGSHYKVEIVNTSALELWGRREEEVINRPILEVMSELESQGIKGLLDSVYQTGNPFKANELPVQILKEGQLETVYINFVYEPIYDSDGTVNGIMAVGMDVTSHVISRKKIEESEIRFRTMAEGSDILITVSDETSNATYFNNAWADLTGNPVKDLLDFGWADLIHPEDRQGFVEIYVNAFEKREIWTGEFRILNKEGSYSWLLSKGTPRFGAEGSFEGYISSCIDITERKQAEEAIKRFKFMADNANDPFILMREDGTFEYLNTLALERWGYTAEEATHLRVPEVDPIYNDEVFSAAFAKAQKENITPFETIHKKKNGTVYPVEVNMGGITFGEKPYLFAVARDITERKKTEEEFINALHKIEESEIRFRKIADNAPVLIKMAGTDKNFIFFNKEFLDFTGNAIEDEFGFGWVKGVHPEDLQKFLNIFDTAFDKRETFYVEYRLKRYDGEYRWISHKGVPRFTTNGIFEGYIGASMDIHEKIIYQKKLQENEEKLNIVIDASELGTWELNLETREVAYSDRYLEILGYKERVNLTHVEILKHLHPDDLPIREKAFEKAFNTGSLHYSSRIIWNDKSIHWIEGRGKMFYDEEHKPVKLLGTLRDITEEKYRQQELEESEAKFRVLADSMPQLVWTGNAEGDLNYFNQSVFDYSGLTPEQVYKDGWIQIVHPDDREENISKWIHSVTSGTNFLFEHRFLKNTGEYRWQLSRAIPQKDTAGNIQMWVGTSTDIEDQKMFAYNLEKLVEERTKELEQKNKELEKMNGELQSFAYVSSHDLQEPLRKIQTFATRILEKEHQNLSETGKDYFKRMQGAAVRMQTLIQDLLTYSRTNTTERIFKNTDLSEIINEVKNDIKETLAEKHATLEIDKMCHAQVIPFQFRQLVYNLLSNSLKFSKPGTPPHIFIKSKIVKGSFLHIESLSPNKMYCHLSISDNGIGFDPQYKDRIFEVFQRLHGKDEYKGTGIGLAIVKKIVENHNGFITATGELNKGATFDIYFPTT